jgi:O-succinylbenzoate synthase
LKIDKIVVRKLKMDLQFPFETSFGTQTDRECLIVEAHSGEVVGYGEGVASTNPYYSEETVVTTNHILGDFLIPLVLSNEVTHPSEINDLFSGIRRNSIAKASIETALWDLYAKLENRSLADVMGGKKEKIGVGVSIGIQSTKEELLRKVEESLKLGYNKVKIKIKPGKDIDYLRAVREKFPDTPIMADANSAYTLNDIDLFKEMDDLNLMMIEQPLAHDDIIDHATLQKAILTPICLDESIHSVEDTRKAIELGSCKIINIKIGRVGGISEAIKIHDLCQENNIPVWCGGMLESGIGRAHNVAITSLENFTIPGDTAPSARYWMEDIIIPEVTMDSNGYIEIPKGPGIGYNINQEALERYTVEEETYVNTELLSKM